MITDSNFYTYDENLESYNTKLEPYRINNAGVYYKAQDEHWYDGYNFNPIEYTFDSAYITAWIAFEGSVKTWARTHFTHIWSSAEISGVSITKGAIYVNISNNSYSWDSQTNEYCSISYLQ